jgi:hypothetical protein
MSIWGGGWTGGRGQLGRTALMCESGVGANLLTADLVFGYILQYAHKYI